MRPKIDLQKQQKSSSLFITTYYYLLIYFISSHFTIVPIISLSHTHPPLLPFVSLAKESLHACTLPVVN